MQILDMRSFSSYKDYLVDRVKKVIESCMTKEQIFTAIDYLSLAAIEIAGADNDDASDWMDYFRPMIFAKVEFIKANGWDYAFKWTQKRYNRQKGYNR